jgi:F-type H+-transporting ATPase subunit epsilon
VELVTPERILFQGEAEFVVLRSDGGEIMFLPNHAPYIGAVDISLMRVAPAGREDEQAAEFRAAVHGGFVQVVNNKVTVLASVAEPAAEIDVERARRALTAAEGALAAGEPAEAAPAEATEGAGEQVEQSPTMQALLSPDDPEVAARRARARLEATGISPGEAVSS